MEVLHFLTRWRRAAASVLDEALLGQLQDVGVRPRLAVDDLDDLGGRTAAAALGNLALVVSHAVKITIGPFTFIYFITSFL